MIGDDFSSCGDPRADFGPRYERSEFGPVVEARPQVGLIGLGFKLGPDGKIEIML